MILVILDSLPATFRDDLTSARISNDVPSFIANDHTDVAAPVADTGFIDVLGDPTDVITYTSIEVDASTLINPQLL